MKRIWLVSLIVIIAVLLTSIPVMGASPDGNQGKGPIDKIIFVHYPKNASAKPGGGGGSGAGTGALCPDYKYTGIRWASGVVNYSVNTSGSGLTSDPTLQAVKASFATWDNASSGLTFNEPLTTTSAGGIRDGVNVVSWGSVSYANAIAVTYFWYYRNSKAIYECDTVMNNGAGFNWSYTPPTITGTEYADPTNSGDPTKYDVRNIMTHEAGHWILLDDLYNGRDSYLTMYGYGSLGEIKKDTLGYGDKLGVQKAYGP